MTARLAQRRRVQALLLINHALASEAGIGDAAMVRQFISVATFIYNLRWTSVDGSIGKGH